MFSHLPPFILLCPLGVHPPFHCNTSVLDVTFVLIYSENHYAITAVLRTFVDNTEKPLLLSVYTFVDI